MWWTNEWQRHGITGNSQAGSWWLSHTVSLYERGSGRLCFASSFPKKRNGDEQQRRTKAPLETITTEKKPKTTETMTHDLWYIAHICRSIPFINPKQSTGQHTYIHLSIHWGSRGNFRTRRSVTDSWLTDWLWLGRHSLTIIGEWKLTQQRRPFGGHCFCCEYEFRWWWILFWCWKNIYCGWLRFARPPPAASGRTDVGWCWWWW